MTVWQKGRPSDLPIICCSLVNDLSRSGRLVQKPNGIRHALPPLYLQSSRAPELLLGDPRVELALGKNVQGGGDATPGISCSSSL